MQCIVGVRRLAKQCGNDMGNGAAGRRDKVTLLLGMRGGGQKSGSELHPHPPSPCLFVLFPDSANPSGTTTSPASSAETPTSG